MIKDVERSSVLQVKFCKKMYEDVLGCIKVVVICKNQTYNDFGIW